MGLRESFNPLSLHCLLVRTLGILSHLICAHAIYRVANLHHPITLVVRHQQRCAPVRTHLLQRLGAPDVADDAAPTHYTLQPQAFIE